jgi:hypothetical protein
MPYVAEENDPQDQRAVLLRFLAAPDVRVRHIAATGLAELDDPAAIPELQRALAVEHSERLRAHLRVVLDQLQATDTARLKAESALPAHGER